MAGRCAYEHPRAGAGVGGNIEQDIPAQRRDGVAGAAEGQAHPGWWCHPDGDGAAQQLHELLGEAGRHFRRVRNHNVAAIVALHRRARHGHDIGRRSAAG